MTPLMRHSSLLMSKSNYKILLINQNKTKIATYYFLYLSAKDNNSNNNFKQAS